MACMITACNNVETDGNSSVQNTENSGTQTIINGSFEYNIYDDYAEIKKIQRTGING